MNLSAPPPVRLDVLLLHDALRDLYVLGFAGADRIAHDLAEFVFVDIAIPIPVILVEGRLNLPHDVVRDSVIFCDLPQFLLIWVDAVLSEVVDQLLIRPRLRTSVGNDSKSQLASPNHTANLSMLVFGCIENGSSKQVLIWQHYFEIYKVCVLNNILLVHMRSVNFQRK